jgi:2'-5' RNA ligase
MLGVMSRAPSASARLFAALEPPLTAREELAAWGRSVSSALGESGRPESPLRPMGVDTLHLTLCFLGARPLDELEPLSSAVEALEPASPVLEVGAPLLLPRRRPRALAVAVADEDGELERLQADVSRALASVSGWKPPSGRFTPHITVARMRAGGAPGIPLPPTPRLRFRPEAVVLYRSFLEPAGARHERIAALELGSV